MNLLQGGLLGPFLIYEAYNPNPNLLRTAGVLVLGYHLYQLYIKGMLPDMSDTPRSEGSISGGDLGYILDTTGRRNFGRRQGAY